VLVPIRGKKDLFADLQQLAKRNVKPGEVVKARGEEISLPALKLDLAFWWNESCAFYFIDADQFRRASEAEFPEFLNLQELLQKHPSWVEKRTLYLREVCHAAYAGDTLAVSHRWELEGKCDSSGEQLRALRQHVKLHPHLKWLWFDQMSLPQGVRTPAEKAEFSLMLSNVNFLYLGCAVLILLDRSYLSRFWTCFEAYLAFRSVSHEGLIYAPNGSTRCEIACLHGSSSSLENALRDEWERRTPSEAASVLGKPDVMVTNQSDKRLQIPKLALLDEQVKELMRRHNDSPANEAVAPPRAPPEAATVTPSLPACQIDGLAELMGKCNLLAQLDLAISWCVEKGVDSIEELKYAEMEEDFVAGLDLKEAKSRVLAKRLKEA